MQIKSRLLQRLDRDIAAAGSPWHSACLRAQRAILLARHGQLAVAREQLTELHQLAFQHPHPEIGPWLQLAEGLMNFYSEYTSGAQDKVQRAQSAARKAGLREVEALSSAWLVHLAYERHDLDAVILNARLCREVAAPTDHAALGRLSIALGLVHLFVEQQNAAQAWYAQARRHAMTEGDEASLSALMYNMAEMRTAQARHRVLASLGSAPVPELLLGADSVKNYDDAIGIAAKAELTPLLRAQVLSLRGEFEAACQLYDQYLPQAMSMGMERLGSNLLADLAWCRVKVGQREQALQQAGQAELELDPGCDVDDRAATHSRLAQVYEALGDAAQAQRHAQHASREWAAFAEEKRRWAAALAQAELSRP